VPTILSRAVTAAGGVNYVKPLIYFGSLGALGGFAFWVSLIGSGTFEETAAMRRDTARKERSHQAPPGPQGLER
jgi:hypothetical protein